MTDHVLTEIWKPLPAWDALTATDRQAYFETKVGAFLGSMMEQGAEMLTCAVNTNSGDQRIDYAFMAVWKLPDAAFVDRLVSGARDIGFFDYFEQINFSGPMVGPPELIGAMIAA